MVSLSLSLRNLGCCQKQNPSVYFLLQLTGQKLQHWSDISWLVLLNNFTGISKLTPQTGLHAVSSHNFVTYRNTPKVLYRIAAAVYIAGPLLVYLVPDSSTPLVAAQALVAIGCLAGGTAAFGAASLLGALQNDLVA